LYLIQEGNEDIDSQGKPTWSHRLYLLTILVFFKGVREIRSLKSARGRAPKFLIQHNQARIVLFT